MSSDPPAEQPTRTRFAALLDTFDAQVGSFFTTVTSAVQDASTALVSGDESESDRINQIIEQSEAIMVQTEQQLDLTFALEAPVATDLHRMLVSLRVMPSLERGLELARHIAERAEFADQFPPDVLNSFGEMGGLATAMWEEATGAWQSRSPDVGAKLDEDDDELDALSKHVAERLGQLQDRPVVAMEGRLIVRFYERLGDHAVHVSQRIANHTTGHEPEPN
ncbi:MAG: hypothetical protein FWC87_07260 [Acidimicrobiaceae bacterium]|nr:hypothetical protein [Acidimicrobiaceae bacterium]